MTTLFVTLTLDYYCAMIIDSLLNINFMGNLINKAHFVLDTSDSISSFDLLQFENTPLQNDNNIENKCDLRL